jgi:predicted secreted protein
VLRFLRLLITAPASLILCAASITSDQTPRYLTEANDGQEIRVRLRDMIEIALGGNPAAGYRWEAVESDVAVLKQVGETSFRRSPEPDGSGGTFYLMFEVIGRGQTQLRLAYHRPFEVKARPQRTFAVKVVVR